MDSELENVKAENRDLKFDNLTLNRKLDTAHESSHFLFKKCEDLERQLRDSEHLLRIVLETKGPEAKLE